MPRGAHDLALLEELLAAGEWLRATDVGVLLATDRWVVDDLAKTGRLPYRTTLGGIREFDPAGVRELREERFRVRRG